MDDPLIGPKRRVELAEITERLGIEEERACTFTAQLNEESALTVSDSRSSFGVDGDGPRGGGQTGDRGGEILRGVDDVGDAVRGCFQKR